MTKSELRIKYKKLRNQLSNDEIDVFSLSIANQLLKMPIWGHTFCHIYLTIEEQKEVNTDYVLNILSGKDKNIVISKSDFETGNMMHFLLTDNTTIKKNS
ncbi:MAG: 5-formyltetrahydrofolate cyclo-ligase, partial [Flaviramulus sp.]|nr:5-formyltetrahydrofolate cyclo-ligase [Flaviramulus sp.]